VISSSAPCGRKFHCCFCRGWVLINSTTTTNDDDDDDDNNNDNNNNTIIQYHKINNYNISINNNNAITFLT